MSLRWLYVRWLTWTACLLAAAAGSVVLGRDDAVRFGIRGPAGLHLERWLNGLGGGIEASPSYEQALASVVGTFQATARDHAKARLRRSIEAMLEHARAPGAISVPEMGFSKTEWICGGCLIVDWWDWAEMNTDYGIEPFEFIGADPRDAISRAFVSCRKLTIEQIDGTAGRRTTDDAGEIHATCLDLMLGVVAGDEPWLQPEWGLIAPQDFTASLRLRPNLRVTMTDEIFLLAEIDARQGRIVIHSDGKRGVYRWRTRHDA